MRSQGLVVLFVALATALVVAPAGAEVLCGTPVNLGGCLIEITVTSAGFTSVGGAVMTPGLVTETGITSNVGAPACNTTPPTQQDSSCTFTIQGTPGGGVQSWSRIFDDGSGPVTCTVTDLEGLPVELLSFSVE